MGRRTAVVAASSGLLVSMIGVAAAPAASAATVGNQPDKLNTVDLSVLTAKARQALEFLPAVTVATDATFTIETAPVTVTPAPEATPAPAPEPVVRAQNTSRTTVRTDIQDRQTEREQRRAEAADDADNDAPEVTPAPERTEAPAPQVVPAVVKKAAVAAPASANGSSVISIAARYVGVPYVYGGSTPDGFDCSGFTSYVYRQVGINLPRSSGAQGGMGTRVSRSEARPGDLVWTPGHIAIYAGDGMIIDAPRPGKTIQFRAMWQSNPRFIRL